MSNEFAPITQDPAFKWYTPILWLVIVLLILIVGALVKFVELMNRLVFRFIFDLCPHCGAILDAKNRDTCRTCRRSLSKTKKG